MIDIDSIPVTVDDVEYLGKDLSPEAQSMLRHAVDLHQQQEQLRMRLEQLNVAEHAFKVGLENTVQKDRREAS